MKTILSILFVSLIAISAIAQTKPTLYGTVDQVSDGDTVRVRFTSSATLRRPPYVVAIRPGMVRRVRLRMVDAPEYNRYAPKTNQPGGLEAKVQLAEMIKSWRKIRVVAVHIDPDYPSRLIGFVQKAYCPITDAGCDAGFLLLKNGWAWHEPEYAVSDASPAASYYAKVWEGAKAGKAGLWSGDEEPVRPKEWRAGHRGARFGDRGFGLYDAGAQAHLENSIKWSDRTVRLVHWRKMPASLFAHLLIPLRY